MARGGPRPELEPHDPDQWIHFTRRSKMQWRPELVPALLTWITMLERQYTDAKSDMMGRHHQLPPQAKAQMIQTLDESLRALRTLAGQVTQQWRRIDWYDAAALVMRAIESGVDMSPRGESVEE